MEKYKEGISFQVIDIKERTKNALRAHEFEVNITAADLSNFIKQQSNKKYSLRASNCIHFAFDFGMKFMPDYTIFTQGFKYFGKELAKLWGNASIIMIMIGLLRTNE